jgi:DNA gyrase/topoisomerase IV subunit B
VSLRVLCDHVRFIHDGFPAERRILMPFEDDAIRWLKDLEHVRVRPKMYIGSVGSDGLHVLLSTVLDNAVDEAMQGHCRRARVTLFGDGSISIEDDGRGIPVELHRSSGCSALEVVFTKLGACGCGCGELPGHRGLRSGIGLAVVNALSEFLVVETTRDGRRYRASFERGTMLGDLARLGRTTIQGTLVRFLPDRAIFPSEARLDRVRLEKELRDHAALVPGLSLELRDEREGEPVSSTFLAE